MRLRIVVLIVVALGLGILGGSTMSSKVSGNEDKKPGIEKTYPGESQKDREFFREHPEAIGKSPWQLHAMTLRKLADRLDHLSNINSREERFLELDHIANILFGVASDIEPHKPIGRAPISTEM